MRTNQENQEQENTEDDQTEEPYFKNIVISSDDNKITEQPENDSNVENNVVHQILGANFNYTDESKNQQENSLVEKEESQENILEAKDSEKILDKIDQNNVIPYLT